MEKFYKNQNIIDGELDQNQVMLDLEKGKYLGLNPVGKRIWDLLDQPQTFDEITNTLLKEYQVDKDTCVNELNSFIDKALKYGIIEKRA